MHPDPVLQLTRAFLEADGFDPDEELNATDFYGLGIVGQCRKVAEIAVETLKGIGWGEVEPYREALEELEEWGGEHCGDSGCLRCRDWKKARELLSRPEGDA